jgi:hypothetical protein
MPTLGEYNRRLAPAQASRVRFSEEIYVPLSFTVILPISKKQGSIYTPRIYPDGCR